MLGQNGCVLVSEAVVENAGRVERCGVATRGQPSWLGDTVTAKP
jgi:hypothetical protein